MAERTRGRGGEDRKREQEQEEKTHRRARRKAKGHRAERETTGDKNKKQEKRTIGTANKIKENTDGRSGSVSNSKQLALLHHADLMLHSTGAAVVSEQGGRSAAGAGLGIGAAETGDGVRRRAVLGVFAEENLVGLVVNREGS
jgi:hypothetical protein